MIRLISGSTRVGNNTYTPANGAFKADKESEARLVACNVAEYVQEDASARVATADTDEETTTPNVNTPDDKKAGDGVLGGSENIPEISMDMTAQELREIGKPLGIKFGIGTTKEEMVRILKEHYGIADDEDVPNINAEAPIV